jgi:hypothetical protein
VNVSCSTFSNGQTSSDDEHSIERVGNKKSDRVANTQKKSRIKYILSDMSNVVRATTPSDLLFFVFNNYVKNPMIVSLFAHWLFPRYVQLVQSFWPDLSSQITLLGVSMSNDTFAFIVMSTVIHSVLYFGLNTFYECVLVLSCLRLIVCIICPFP